MNSKRLIITLVVVADQEADASWNTLGTNLKTKWMNVNTFEYRFHSMNSTKREILNLTEKLPQSLTSKSKD